jgi:hypothetical protein
MMGAFASLAASNAATTVDEEVTFYKFNWEGGRGYTIAGMAN